MFLYPWGDMHSLNLGWFLLQFKDWVEKIQEYLDNGGGTSENLANVIAPVFNAANSYSTGDYVLYNNELYKANQAVAPGTWDQEKWDQVLIVDEMGSGGAGVDNVARLMIAGEYSPSFGYLKYAICRYNDKLWMANTDLPSGGEAWNANHWDEITIGAGLTGLRRSVETMNTALKYHGNEYAGKRLLMIGDSWLAGYTGTEGSSDISKGWTKSCSDILKCGMYRIRQPGGGFCQPGSSISAYPNKTYIEALEQFRADYPSIDFYAIIVQGGVNDLIHSWTGNDLSAAFIAFKALVDEYYPNAKLFLIPTWGNILMSATEFTLARLYIQYAQYNGFNACTKSFNWFIDCWATSLHGADNYHLSYLGYDYLGKWIAEYVLTGEENHVTFGWTTQSGNNPLVNVAFDSANTDAANSSYVINGNSNLISFFARIKIASTATSGFVTLMSGIPITIINGVYLHVRNNDGSNDPVPRMYLAGNELRMYPDGVDRSGKTFTADIMYFAAQNIR